MEAGGGASREEFPPEFNIGQYDQDDENHKNGCHHDIHLVIKNLDFEFLGIAHSARGQLPPEFFNGRQKSQPWIRIKNLLPTSRHGHTKEEEHRNSRTPCVTGTAHLNNEGRAQAESDHKPKGIDRFTAVEGDDSE